VSKEGKKPGPIPLGWQDRGRENRSPKSFTNLSLKWSGGIRKAPFHINLQPLITPPTIRGGGKPQLLYHLYTRAPGNGEKTARANAEAEPAFPSISEN